MPKAGDQIEYQGWCFKVVKIQSLRIERMRIQKLASDDEAEEGADE